MINLVKNQPVAVNVTAKKPTMSTVKSFIKKNFDQLYINVKSSFDGMTDGCECRHDGFTKVQRDETKSLDSDYHKATQGIKGAWFVGSSRDYIQHYRNIGGDMIGFEISNSCGRFILAIKL